MHIYEIKKNGTDETICQAEIEIQTTEPTYGYQGEKGRGRMNWDIGVDICTLLILLMDRGAWLAVAFHMQLTILHFFTS